MRFAESTIASMRLFCKQHLPILLVMIVSLIPAAANCEVHNWRDQMQAIGSGDSQATLIEKRLLLKKALSDAEASKKSNFANYAEIAQELAAVYASEGDLTQAERTLTSAAEVTPYPADENDPIKFPLGKAAPNMVANVYRRLGWIDTKAKRYDYAVKAYLFAQRVFAESLESKGAQLAGIKNDLAVLNFEKGDYFDAAECFREALAKTEYVTEYVMNASKPNAVRGCGPVPLEAMRERFLALSGYSKTLSKLKKTSEAEEMLKKANDFKLDVGRFGVVYTDTSPLRPSL